MANHRRHCTPSLCPRTLWDMSQVKDKHFVSMPPAVIEHLKKELGFVY